MVVKRFRVSPCLYHVTSYLQYFKFVCFVFYRRFDVMVSFFRTLFCPASRRVTAIFLAFTLLAGLFIGAYTATLADPSSFSMMRTASNSCVSIVCLLSALLLPFIFTAFAVYISQYWLLIPIAFFKAFSFGYLSTGFMLLFHESGWLLRLLLMFTDCLSMPILCWLWLHSCCGCAKSNFRAFVSAFLIMLGIVCLDYQYISPFLVKLLS